MTTVDLKVVALSSPCSGSWDQSAAASQWHCGFGPGTSLWPAPPPPDLPAECPSPAPALSFASAVGEQNSKQLMRMKERKGLGWKGKRTKETKHFFKEINHSRPDSKETKKKTSFSQERQKTKNKKRFLLKVPSNRWLRSGFHRSICSERFCADGNNGNAAIVWRSLRPPTMFRGAISPLSWQLHSNLGMGQTGDPLQPRLTQCVCVCVRERVCVCLCGSQSHTHLYSKAVVKVMVK